MIIKLVLTANELLDFASESFMVKVNYYTKESNSLIVRHKRWLNFVNCKVDFLITPTYSATDDHMFVGTTHSAITLPSFFNQSTLTNANINSVLSQAECG